MKKFLPIILTILTLAACQTKTPATTTTTTTTTAATTTTATTATTTVNPFAKREFTADYGASSNAALGGLVAFDDKFIYYTTDNRIHGRSLDDEVSLKFELVAETSPIKNICVYGEYVFYAVDGMVKSVRNDGGPGLNINPSVGSFFYMVDDTIVYTLPSGNTYIQDVGGADPVNLGKSASFINFANGELTYADGQNIKVYNLAKGEFTFDYASDRMISGLIRYEDKIIYRAVSSANDRDMTELLILDVKTGALDSVFAGSLNKTVKPGDEYFSGQSWVSSAFNVNPNDEMLYFSYLTDYDTDGFHKRAIYRRDLGEIGSQEVLAEISETPYPKNPPDAAFYSTPDGVFYFNTDGELVKI
ncbi:MAG: hypothetical protein LBL98_05600 [Ruminococcus sp.]|jgi:hypothetical protein|nr:hypothetical protein [Ruminococcus sp.]